MKLNLILKEMDFKGIEIDFLREIELTYGCGVKLEIELVKELESHVKDKQETDMVDCGEMSREFKTFDFKI